MRIPIVTLSDDASGDVRQLFASIAHGSVVVAKDSADGVSIYYEGGIYNREPQQPPTPEQREQYARVAADRAVSNYPTVGRFTVPDWSGLTIIGYVETETWSVIFKEPTEPYDG